MEAVLGIDLGTTNSVAAIVHERHPEVLLMPGGQQIVPSVVGIDRDGKMLVGEPAVNQALVAPERTVRSVKRRMGQADEVQLGDRTFAPEEISAEILKYLAEQARQQTGLPLRKAVITVPAFFKDPQRAATRAAGQLAGLEVVRIVNEPTAAALVYDPDPTVSETVMVYDLGGGTFDVSIVRVEQGVVEVLASTGDTELGGDDFDELLLEETADRFLKEHGVDLRQDPRAKSRLLVAVEAAKRRLSSEPLTRVTEEFIIEHEGRSLSLDMELRRADYEQLILPLVERTLEAVRDAMQQASLKSQDLDRILLVGGSSRTPLVHRFLQAELGVPLHSEIDPDLCVGLGAAVQGALISGQRVENVLVDITPHSLGVETAWDEGDRVVTHRTSFLIPRNSALPISRSDLFCPLNRGQDRVEIHVVQGESPYAPANRSLGRFFLEELDVVSDSRPEILIHFSLDLDGILKVTATEVATGRDRSLTIDRAADDFRSRWADDEGVVEEAARPDAASETRSGDISNDSLAGVAPSGAEQPMVMELSQRLLERAEVARPQLTEEDVEELDELTKQTQAAIAAGELDRLVELNEELDDLLFYVQEDAS